MAVTIAQLAVALRVIVEESDTIPPAHLATLTRLSGAADAVIELRIPHAPDAIKDEVKVRFCAYLLDAPSSARGDFYGNAWRNSGAGGLATRWEERRAGIPSESTSTDSGETAPQRTGQEIVDLITEVLGNDHWKTGGTVANVPAATDQIRGGVLGITNDVIDADTSTGWFAWRISHVKRLINALIPDWARGARSIAPGDLARDPNTGEVLRVQGNELQWRKHPQFRGISTESPNTFISAAGAVVDDWYIQIINDGTALRFFERVGDDNAANWNARATVQLGGDGTGGGVTLEQVQALIDAEPHRTLEEFQDAIGEMFTGELVASYDDTTGKVRLKEGIQDLVWKMFEDNSSMSYDDSDSDGAITLTLPTASESGNTWVLKFFRPGSAPEKIIAQRVGTINANGRFTAWTGVVHYVGVGTTNWTISVANAADFNDAFSGDLRFASGGVSDYDNLADIPIHRVSNVAAIPTPSAENNGRRYQTNNGELYRVEDVVIAGEDRDVPLTSYTSTTYQGAVDHISDIPDPTEPDRGKWWFVRSTVNRGESPFILVNNNDNLQSVAHSPDTDHPYVGAFDSESSAKNSHEVTAAGQLVIYPVSGVYGLYEVGAGFVAGTPDLETHGLVRQDVTSHLLTRIANLESDESTAVHPARYGDALTIPSGQSIPGSRWLFQVPVSTDIHGTDWVSTGLQVFGWGMYAVRGAVYLNQTDNTGEADKFGDWKLIQAEEFEAHAPVADAANHYENNDANNRYRIVVQGGGTRYMGIDRIGSQQTPYFAVNQSPSGTAHHFELEIWRLW